MKSTVVDESLSSYKPMYCSREYQTSTRLNQQYEKSTLNFKEYLLYQPYLIRNGNNPLTYIMTTPNLDATGHQWVGALAKFNFWLEYQKGQDNTMADVLSQINTHLCPEAVQSIQDGVTLGANLRAEGCDPAVVGGDHNIEKEVCVTTG